MSSSGINYYLNKYCSFDLDNHWKINFSFKDTDVISASVSGANTGYSGIYHGNLPLSYDYRNISKSGSSGSYIEILPRTGLWGNEMTLVFLNKKNDSKNGILFNCLETGSFNGENIYKGFLLSYTDGSRPCFSYYGREGLKSYVTDFDVGKNHLIYLVRDSDNITIGKYDYLSQENINNSFSIDSNYLFEPQSGYYIGSKTGNWFPDKLWQNSGYSQIIDEFLFFSYPLFDFDIKMVASGWANDIISQHTGSGIITTTGITGYLTGVVNVTGVTGWGITGTGFLTNEYGIDYTGYLSGNLTGTIYQSGITELTGVILTSEYYIIPESISLNTGFLTGFFSSYITFLRQTDEFDFNSILYWPQKIENVQYNQNGVYDSVDDKFKIFYTGNAMSYVNGVAQFSGQLYNSGSIYEPIYILDRDYFQTGNYLDYKGFYDGNDRYYYQDIYKITFYIKDFMLDSFIPTGDLLFYNGQRLYSGENLTRIGLLYALKNTYSGLSFSTGDLCVINIEGISKEETGNFAWKKTSQNFNSSHSIVYMNGIRQIINEDYLASDESSLLSGSGSFYEAKSSILDISEFNNIFFN